MEKSCDFEELWLADIWDFYQLNGISCLFTRFTKIVRVRFLSKSWTWLLQNYIPASIPFILTPPFWLHNVISWREVRAKGVRSDALPVIGSLRVLGDRRISWYLSHCGGGLAVGRGCSWNNHSPKKHSYIGALTVSPNPLHPPIT